MNTKVNSTKDRKVHADKKFDLGKTKHHILNSLGTRLNVVVRQKADELAAIHKFQQLHSKVHLGCFNGFIVVSTLYQ